MKTNEESLENLESESQLDDNQLLRDKIADLEAKNQHKDEEIKTLNGKLLRIAADLDNNIKRNKKELDDTLKFGNTKIIKEILSIYDILETAMAHINEDNIKLHKEFEDLFNGLKMSKAELWKLMENTGVTKVFPVRYDRFDHNLHEAMSKVSDPEVELGFIVNTIRPGYILHERLLRAAMVVVSSGK